MARHTYHKALREKDAAEKAADAATKDAVVAKEELSKKTQAEKDKALKDRQKSQRIMMRSLRAGGGGYFETDSNLLGGSGDIS